MAITVNWLAFVFLPPKEKRKWNDISIRNFSNATAVVSLVAAKSLYSNAKLRYSLPTCINYRPKVIKPIVFNLSKSLCPMLISSGPNEQQVLPHIVI